MRRRAVIKKTLGAAALAGATGLAAAGNSGNTGLHYQFWDLDISGYVEDGDSRLDFDRDLQVEPRQERFYSFRWNTGPGYWPDISAAYTPIDAEGRSTSSASGGQILDIPIGVGGSTTALIDADIDDWELSFSYPLQLGSSAVAIGLTAKKLDGEVLILENGQTEVSREEINQTFPQLHLGLTLPLAKNFLLETAGNYVRAEGDQVHDWHAAARLQFGKLCLSGGWQERRYQVQNTSYDIDARLSGAFAGLGLVF